MCARVCTPAFPSKGWNAEGGNGRPRVQSNTLLPPSTLSLCVCVHVSHWRVYTLKGAVSRITAAHGEGAREVAICLCRLSFEGCTLSRCAATLSPRVLHSPFSLYPSFGVGSLRSHARQLTFRCRNRTFRHHHRGYNHLRDSRSVRALIYVIRILARYTDRDDRACVTLRFVLRIVISSRVRRSMR